MADPKKPGSDRTREVEALAATLYPQMLLAARGQKTADHIAREALEAARAFYQTIDQAPPG